MSRFVVLATVAGLLISASAGQNGAPAKPKLGPSGALLASWNEIGRKLIALAEDFTEDKYDFKPTAAQKSFAEQLLHVSGDNVSFADVAQGKKPTGDESRTHFDVPLSAPSTNSVHGQQLGAVNEIAAAAPPSEASSSKARLSWSSAASRTRLCTRPIRCRAGAQLQTFR